jgi:chloramphenicol 3-O-phosphotransferase
MADIWIINGIPGAGKTTTARALASSFHRGVDIEGDRLQEFIVSGSVPPGGQPQLEEERQIHLNVRNQCLLACSFAQDDFTPIIDYVIVNRARVEEYRQQLTGLKAHLITLSPGVPVALERDLRRPDKTVAHIWAHLDEIMRTEFDGVGLWIDNSNLTLEGTVNHIVSHQEEVLI